MYVKNNPSQSLFSQIILLVMPFFFGTLLFFSFENNWGLDHTVGLFLGTLISIVLCISELRKNKLNQGSDFLQIDKAGISWIYNGTEQNCAWDEVILIKRAKTYPGLSVVARDYLQVRVRNSEDSFLMLNHFGLTWSDVSEECKLFTRDYDVIVEE